MPVIPYNPEKSSVQVVKTSSYTKDKISSMIVIILIKFPTIRKGGGPKITRIGECSYRNCPTHTHTHTHCSGQAPFWEWEIRMRSDSMSNLIPLVPQGHMLLKPFVVRMNEAATS